jgi:hypothetical protein
MLILLSWGGFKGFLYYQSHPQNFPWTELDLDQPIGLFTGRKLTALRDDFTRCKKLMDAVNFRYEELSPRGKNECYADGLMRPKRDGLTTFSYLPADVAPSCAVLAALTLWERRFVQPAAQRYFGQTVSALRHYGAYNCRPIYGGSSRQWSEHATANAIDIAGFTLADGTRLNIHSDWEGDSAKALFLHEIRDGACRLFATVLSPDYNDAHSDHLHFDQAERGIKGWRLCR